MIRASRILLLAAIALVAGSAPARAQPRVELTLAATTDVHGRLRAWDYYADRPDPVRGLARAATIVDSLRRAAPGRVILVDAGDLLQGNPMTYVAARIDSTRPSPVVAAMNVMRYDAAAVGNHEFNYGLPIFDRARTEATFPFLAANTRRLDGGQAFPARTMVTRAGVKVAIIGVTTPGSMVWDRDHLRGRLEVTDIVAALPPQIAAARAEGADLVVVVAHAGLGGESSYDTVGTGLASENPMARVAQEVRGIDVLVIGHSHREVADSTIAGVLVIQPRNWATSVATATIALERAETGWQVMSRRGRLVQARDHAEQPAVVRAVARAHQSAVRHANEVIGRTDVAWRTDSARVRDEPLIDLIQAAQLRATGAQLSIASAFTLDARLEPGPISVRQIAQLYPYENSLRALRLSGAQLRAFLEHSARYWIVEADGSGGFRTRPDPTIPGYNYDILAGAEYVVDLARPMGSRIATLTYQGRPVADADTFTVAVNNYRAGGAGGYAMLRGAPVVYESPTEIRDLVIAEVRRRGDLTPEEIGERNYRLLPPRRTVRVLAINDFHGALTKRPVGTIGNRGGVAELATMIREAGAACAPICVPIVLHGGDMFQGTAASNLAFGRTVVPILEALGVAAGALGNHEFDWGQDTLRARMRELKPLILGANVRDPDGGEIDWIPDDTLVTREGVRIGIIGLADMGTPRTTMPRYVANLRFLPPAIYVRERAAVLRARGADAVVVVAHIGGFCEIAAPDQCRGEIIELAKELPTGSVDAIVSGHTHSAITTVVNGIPVVQARSNGQALGVIDIALGGGTPQRPELRAVVSDSVRRDPVVAALVAEAEAAVASRIAAPVTTAEARFARSGDQYPLGNLIADAQRAAGRGDLAVMNNGGIRTEIRQGAVTWGDLFEVQPFGNRLVAVTIRGDALRRYLEALVDGRGIRYHLSGVTIEYDPSAPSGSRLRSVRFDDGRALENGRRYRIVMTDFLATGGDGATLTRDARVEDLNRVDLDALIQHLQGLPGGRLTLTPALQAPRITPIQ